MGTPKGTMPWNTGTSKGWVDKRGYRWVYVLENGRRVARREHRVLMEQHLGRKLEPWELVHHKDGDKTNNTLTNLEVAEWGLHTAQHHLGGRKSEDTRRTMKAFALMREQMKREREIKSDLLAALKDMNAAFVGLLHAGYERIVEQGGVCDPVELMEASNSFLKASRAAIAKAEGGAA